MKGHVLLRRLLARLNSFGTVPLDAADSARAAADRLIAAGNREEEQGNFPEACAHYRKAVQAAPGYATARLNLGIGLEGIADTEGATRAYEAALAIDPASAYASYNLGKLFYRRGELSHAERLLRAALNHKPGFPEAQVVLSSVYEAQGNLGAALSALEVALNEQPDWAGALFNYGMVLKKLGRLEEATSALRRVIATDSGNIEATYELASLLQAGGAAREAGGLYRTVLEHRPEFAEAHGKLGAVYKDLDDLPRAESCLRRAIALNPEYVAAWYLLGDLLFKRGERDEAIDALEKALDLQPEFFLARWERAMAQIPAVYRDAREIAPSRAAFSQQFTDMQAWIGKNAVLSDHEAVGTLTPFNLAYTEENNRDLLALHGELCASLMGTWLRTLGRVPASRVNQDRIEIGIVSTHVFDHSVWNAVIKGWIRHLDTSRYSVSIFHLNSRADGETGFARSRSSHFEDGKRPLADWVRSILSRRPDILIYAEIAMEPLALRLASLRLAPVQAATWGHPETTGLPTMDYFLSAEDLEPAGSQAYYTESLIKLPGLGVCYEPLPIEPVAPDLRALGIDDGCPLLLCPGTPYKYSPRHDWVYVDIARSLGDCQMVFFTGVGRGLDQALRHRLWSAFGASGLDFDRYVKFVPWLNRAGFHGLMKRADVFLDPIGFSGFNTAMEAVGCGLPIVTREGRFMRGRLASAILDRMGLRDLIAGAEREYIDLAVKLASDAHYRDSIRARILQARSVLYNDIAPVQALQEFVASVAGKKLS